MRVDLTGVWDDGTAWPLGEVAPTPRRLVVSRGNDAALRIRVRTPAGIVVTNAGSATLSLAIRERAVGGARQKKVAGTFNAKTGLWTISLIAATTRALDVGTYAYDVLMIRSSARQIVVALAQLDLTEATTET